jgi:hypothetical protein
VEKIRQFVYRHNTEVGLGMIVTGLAAVQLIATRLALRSLEVKSVNLCIHKDCVRVNYRNGRKEIYRFE